MPGHITLWLPGLLFSESPPALEKAPFRLSPTLSAPESGSLLSLQDASPQSSCYCSPWKGQKEVESGLLGQILNKGRFSWFPSQRLGRYGTSWGLLLAHLPLGLQLLQASHGTHSSLGVHESRGLEKLIGMQYHWKTMMIE